jgi:hypothetical protein
MPLSWKMRRRASGLVELGLPGINTRKLEEIEGAMRVLLIEVLAETGPVAPACRFDRSRRGYTYQLG